MTGLLADALHERADTLGPPDLDVDRIVQDGDRRVRHGRTGVAVAAAALVAAAAGGVAVADHAGDDRPAVATTLDESAPLSYASGSEIHVGDTVLDVGEVVQSFVLTDAGPVWTTAEGDVMTEQDGAPVRLGRTSTDGYYLKADGSLAAWVEFPDGSPAEFVVYDTAARSEVLRSTEGTSEGMKAFRDDRDVAYVYAVDGRSVYWHSNQGAVRHDLDTGDSEVLGDVGAFAISDVAGGLIAYQLDPGTSGMDTEGVFVGPSLREGTDMRHQGTAYLSADGSYVSFEDADEMFVSDTATGADATPAVKGYPFHVVSQWLDDDTAAVFGLRSTDEHGPLDVDFLSCDIPTAQCTVVGHDTVTYGEFQLPIGEHIGD
jgi:hypothetical protein